MLSDCCFCEYCRENHDNHKGLTFQDDQWLEELGDLIEAAVEGTRQVQPMTVGCIGRPAAA